MLESSASTSPAPTRCEARMAKSAGLAELQQLAQWAQPVARARRRHQAARLSSGVGSSSGRYGRFATTRSTHGTVRGGLLRTRDAVADSVTRRVFRERDRIRVDVGREDLDLRRCNRDRHTDDARSRADVGDAQVLGVDMRDRSVDERLCRRARREHAAGRGEELETVKGRLRENHLVVDWGAHNEREAERYRDGESRLPDLGEPTRGSDS